MPRALDAGPPVSYLPRIHLPSKEVFLSTNTLDLVTLVAGESRGR
ncbi:hypothetical protein DVDV_3000 [Desulfovibrio sp. DV]|nr:hypothetical protein DVDV_3000 [Desulfovibrio sp. DV]